MYDLYQYGQAYDSFVAGLDKGLRAAVDQRLQRLSQFGPRAGPKVTRALRDGIFECRAQRKRQHARLLYFYLKGMKIVVAAGLIKEGKVPATDIDRALAIKRTLDQNPELINDLTEIH